MQLGTSRWTGGEAPNSCARRRLCLAGARGLLLALAVALLNSERSSSGAHGFEIPTARRGKTLILLETVHRQDGMLLDKENASSVSQRCAHGHQCIFGNSDSLPGQPVIVQTSGKTEEWHRRFADRG